MVAMPTRPGVAIGIGMMLTLMRLQPAVAEGLDWVDIPAGCTQIGSLSAYPEERPLTKVCVDGFAITTTEITNAQFAAFVADTGYLTRAERGWARSDPDGPGYPVPPGGAVFRTADTADAGGAQGWVFMPGASWRAPEGPDADISPDPRAPVVQITREDAEAYAVWAGGRLPTEAEWEYAARGGQSWEDPDGTDVSEAAGNTWQGLFPVVNTGDDGFVGLAPVGQFAANAFGLFDMTGNAWEWTSSPYAPSHSPDDVARAGRTGFDPAQPGLSVGVVKGGSFLCSDSFCRRFRPAARQAQDLAFATSHVGFRIVRSLN